jgi:large subunit ribosomal protein L24
MIQSSKPRKQRLFRYTAPLHERQKFVHAHVDKQLREKLKLKKRAIQISRGDSVKVMAGSKKGATGKVTMVNLRSGRIFIDTMKRKNAKGKELGVSISSSNVYITDINLSDKVRAAKLNLKYQPEKKEQKVEKAQEGSLPAEKPAEPKNAPTDVDAAEVKSTAVK